MPNGADGQQLRTLAQSILTTCAERLGGVPALARHLEVPEGIVADWIAGNSVPPAPILLKAVDPLIAPNRVQQ